MHAALLTVFLLAGADIADATGAVLHNDSIRCPCSVGSARRSGGIASGRARRQAVSSDEHFYRPYDYRHQFDYPWHPRVRAMQGYCPHPIYEAGQPTRAGVVLDRTMTN